jgi:NAD(P)-dependent dehydrogenase (short-subunit alcohol dehydrogenase family)
VTPYRVEGDADFPQFSLKGRTALITGGARGCGLAFAQGLAEAGADVAIFDIIEPAAGFHTISKEYGVKTAYYEQVSRHIGSSHSC